MASRWETEGDNVNVMSDDTTDSEESRKERANRELIEMLNELRVALPGVQVLFAFLLTVPFSVGFSEVSDFQRSAYFVTLVASALASGLLIAPAAQHRVLFRQHDKENLLRRSNRYATAGVGVLAVAIIAAVILVLDFIYGRTPALVTGGILWVLLAWWWLALPLRQRSRTTQD
jgi:amino acid transporter